MSEGAGTAKRRPSGPEGDAQGSQPGANQQPPGLALGARVEQQRTGGQQRYRGVERAGHDEPLVVHWFIVPACLPCPGTTSSCTKSSQEAGPDTTCRYCSRPGWGQAGVRSTYSSAGSTLMLGEELTATEALNSTLTFAVPALHPTM